MTQTSDTKLPLISETPLEPRLAALKDLIPEAFTEDKIDFDKLKSALGSVAETSQERYGLTWAGKSEAIRAVQIPSKGTLEPMPEESVNFDKSQNLIIEGDNLEVLKLLQKSYYGKVKMIYIDPPYNTGNEFIYPDNFREGLEDYLLYSGQRTDDGTRLSTSEEAAGRKHSRWLNMMYPRLFLARNLLREDGVIFVSIDDNEVKNLRALMDEVLGEENFIAQMVWEKGRKNDAKLFSIGHEYMCIYGRSLAHLKELQTVWREPKPGAKEIWEKYLQLKEKFGSKHKEIEGELQDWYKHLPEKHPSKKLSRYKQVDEYGPWRDRDISWPGGDGPRYDVIHPDTKKPCAVPERGWAFATKEKMQEQIKRRLVIFREDHTKPPIRKAHLRPVPEELDDDEVDEMADESTDNEEEGLVGMQVMPSVLYKQSQVTSTARG